ncbi:hypothetical protein BDB00DRAFT_926141 [Zychaea mexicana]|uniref:uncharacterized protein n=1 Tax=Zychaea mexicana TaxID=64656 RepID=UPI0022FEE970|nr:uncharacterized protein BDB00DRAFT_926141 [Zychaea mexicana]KAI9497282.1 hypothetical protein BDB00DRAFT_926141 [Zychaea mexicana]
MDQAESSTSKGYPTEFTAMGWFVEDGNISLSGALLALLCLYLLGIRILRLYLFDQAGPSVTRPRPIVQVVVLGDIGRSPRMRCHAVSLADAGCQVDLIGYTDTAPGSRVTTNRHIRVRRIQSAWSVPEGMPRSFYLLWAPFKAIFVACQLVWIMGCITQYPDFIFVQNPPAIPTLVVARVIATLRQARLVIDWHNFGFSVLGIKLGMENKVVQLAKRYEQYFGYNAYAHLTVTDRMNRELVQWGVGGRIITFKDRPPYHFTRLSDDRIHEFLSTVRLDTLVRQQTLNASGFLGYDATASTNSNNNNNKSGDLSYSSISADKFRDENIRLVVSATSWTEDEDFSILLRAIEKYEAYAKKEICPKLLFVITGKGPLKSMYEERISRMTLERTRIVTAWLETADYPLLLGSADLGISLHTSTSGMDLPMKVVDMFGCGLPVCAAAFECLDELVVHGKNGLAFSNNVELAEQLMDLFVREPDSLRRLRSNVIEEYKEQSWEKQWKDIVSDIFIPSTTYYSTVSLFTSADKVVGIIDNAVIAATVSGIRDGAQNFGRQTAKWVNGDYILGANLSHQAHSEKDQHHEDKSVLGIKESHFR